MFYNNVDSEKKELEVVYDVQWKTPGNDDDKAKIIGIVDTTDTNLDWNTFKSYLIQNSGNNMRYTTDDIRISYLDSDDDLIPVDSEAEFRECLKFSRTRARRGRKIMMKISTIGNGGAKPKEINKYEEAIAKSSKPKLFCLKKKDFGDKIRKPAVSFDKACSTPILSAPDGDNKEPMPDWFEKYMKKFKSELVQEITAAVVSNIRVPIGPVQVSMGNSALPRSSRSTEMSSTSAPAGKGHHHHHHHLHHVLEKRKKKKKMPEEDSSDCTDGLQLQWEERLELLRHMQKINKREKKFEKKLDAKLEKLECKTKKIIEKKHCFFGGKKQGNVGVQLLPVTPSAPASNLVMDATPVDEYNYVPHVLRGEIIDKIWKVMNNGQTAWTDETELRFAWGSKSLVPLTTVVKCPPLKPGEAGRVAITLQAPLFPGNFESYWHFHHQGRRFGHWLGCAVIVDAEPRPDTPPAYEPPAFSGDCLYQNEPGTHPVDLTMKCPAYTSDSTYKQSTTDDMKIYNIETNPDATEEEIVQTKVHPEFLSKKKKIALNCRRNRQQYINLSDETGNEDDNTENSFSNFSDSHDIHEVRVADLLNIKEELCEAANGVDVASGGQDVVIEMDKPLKDGEEKELVNKEDGSIEGDVGEYISGSDSDNISIISGTVSVDSDDTEPSDEFVVVPMPTCLNCEAQSSSEPQTLTTDSLPVTEPISVEIPKTPSDSDISQIQASDDNNNNTELKPFPEMPPIFLPALLTNDALEPDVKPDSDDENTVYVRDSEGHSVPVAKVLNRPDDKEDMGKEPKVGIGFNLGVSHTVFGDPNFGHGPNGPRFPFGGFNEATGSPPPHCHNPGGPCNFRPQHEPPVCSVPYTINGMQTSQTSSHFCQPEQQPQQQKQPQQKQQQQQQQTRQQQQQMKQQQRQQQQSGRQTPIQGTFVKPTRQFQYQQTIHHPLEPPTINSRVSSAASSTAWSNAYQNIHTEQPRACKYSYVYSGSKESPTSSKSGSTTSSSGTRRSTTETREASPVAAAVQILPDSLVTGAVNVASSAINTARSVIDMLRPRHEEPVVTQWEPIPPEVERSMGKLQEMGFNNRELNVMLLAKYNNDVNRVISDLVQ